ncbi:triosephosphate isomerase [Candidatus Uhrbacteria bacterium]|nr:triosephosphate isomerase [Candidatus Uhrbacteria bacterium]
MSLKKQYLIANWKMELLPKEERALLEKLPLVLKKKKKSLKVIVCPSFVSLVSATQIKKYSSAIFDVGAQDCHWEERGAYTGEISAKALVSLGCRYVLIGHSERRVHNNEDETVLRNKLQAAFNARLQPIFCIGETRDDRTNGKTLSRLRQQLSSAFSNCTMKRNQLICIAYEPVWSIGSGTPLNADDLTKEIQFIKEWLTTHLSSHPHVVLYGGSVDERSVSNYLSPKTGIDGLLVGSASQSVKRLSKIVSLMSLS